jgi:hypothetical protein
MLVSEKVGGCANHRITRQCFSVCSQCSKVPVVARHTEVRECAGEWVSEWVIECVGGRVGEQCSPERSQRASVPGAVRRLWVGGCVNERAIACVGGRVSNASSAQALLRSACAVQIIVYG